MYNPSMACSEIEVSLKANEFKFYRFRKKLTFYAEIKVTKGLGWPTSPGEVNHFGKKAVQIDLARNTICAPKCPAFALGICSLRANGKASLDLSNGLEYTTTGAYPHLCDPKDCTNKIHPTCFT
jgi:hypothetical protein